MTETIERHPLTAKIETLLRGRSYDDYPADEDLFDELLDEIDEAVLAVVPGAEPENAGRPALDPTPISESIDAILAEVQAKRLDRLSASEKVNAILDTYADAIEAAGGGEDGDPDMWEWSQRVRFAAIPDGYESVSTGDYIAEFGDALTPLWDDPRTDEDA